MNCPLVAAVLLALATPLAAQPWRMGLTAIPPTDPQMAAGPMQEAVADLLYRGLFALRDGVAQPDLAAGIAVSGRAPTQVRITLASAQWSDGRAITAEDAARSLRRLGDPAGGGRHGDLLTALGVKGAAGVLAGKANPDTLGIAVVDGALVLTLDADHDDTTAAQIAAILAHPATAPLPENLQLTSGGYAVAPRKTGAPLVLTGPREIEIHAVPSDIAREIALADGRLDLAVAGPGFASWADPIPIACTAALTGGGPDAAPALRDPGVIEALGLVTHQALTSPGLEDTYGWIRPSRAWLPPEMSGEALPSPSPDQPVPQTEPTADARTPFDRHIADLLARAGFNEELPLSIAVSYRNDPDERALFTHIAATWAHHNIRMLHNRRPFDQLTDPGRGLLRYAACADRPDDLPAPDADIVLPLFHFGYGIGLAEGVAGLTTDFRGRPDLTALTKTPSAP